MSMVEFDVSPRARDYTQSTLKGLIPDESELTAGCLIEPGKQYGFFTDTTVCIGCKACEVACKEWNNLPADEVGLTGHSYDNTGALSANTWRHVAFIEKKQADRAALRTLRTQTGYGVRDNTQAGVPERLADDERRVQALPPRAVHGGLPHRRPVQDRVRHRGGAAGHLQRLRLLRAGLPLRGGGRLHRPTARRTSAPSATTG